MAKRNTLIPLGNFGFPSPFTPIEALHLPWLLPCGFFWLIIHAKFCFLQIFLLKFLLTFFDFLVIFFMFGFALNSFARCTVLSLTWLLAPGRLSKPCFSVNQCLSRIYTLRSLLASPLCPPYCTLLDAVGAIVGGRGSPDQGQRCPFYPMPLLYGPYSLPWTIMFFWVWCSPE